MQGMVVFRKGFVVSNETSMQMMLKMQLRPRPAPGGPGSPDKRTPNASPQPVLPDSASEKGLGPFVRIDRLADRLANCYRSICHSPSPAAGDDMLQLADEARELYAEHSMACLAGIHFRHTKPVSCLHPLYSLFLVEMLAPAFDGGQPSGRLCKAAFTANLGMYELQDEWAKQSGPLDDEQQRQLRNHPEMSVQRLRAVGIDDPLWFAIVRQHHERANGSGYPLGLAADHVLNEALVLGLIDRYLSFVMPRASRTWVHPTAALKKIHDDADACRADIIALFLKRLGVYPPGTSVRLHNGDVAVITHHDVSRPAHPRTVSVGTGANAFFVEPVERDTRQAEYGIKGLYVPDLDNEVNPALMVRSWL
jgi:hypothetical protein